MRLTMFLNQRRRLGFSLSMEISLNILECSRAKEQKFIDMEVDIVREFWYECYGAFAKSAPAHEGIKKCDRCR